MSSATDYVTLLRDRLGSVASVEDVVDVLVPEAADLVLLFVQQGAELRLAAFRHIEPENHSTLSALGEVHHPSIDHATDPVARVVRTGEALMSRWVRREQVEHITPDTRVHAVFDMLQPRNIVVVPLSRAGIRYGAIVAAFSTSGRRFLAGDLEFMQRFALAVQDAIVLP